MANQSDKSKLFSDITIYQSENGDTRIQVRLADETVWSTQNQMAELFQTTKQNISLHIQNILKEGELSKVSTVKDYLTVQKEGNREVARTPDYYNLDMILAIGYHVNSDRGTQFRQWATQRLKEYIVKGFVLNTIEKEKVLKQVNAIQNRLYLSSIT